MNAAINEMSGDHRPDKTMGAVAQPAARNLARPAGGHCRSKTRPSASLLASLQPPDGACSAGYPESRLPARLPATESVAKGKNRRAWRWGFYQLRSWGKHQPLGQTPIGNHTNFFRPIPPLNTACQARRCVSSIAWWPARGDPVQASNKLFH